MKRISNEIRNWLESNMFWMEWTLSTIYDEHPEQNVPSEIAAQVFLEINLNQIRNVLRENF